MKRKSEKRLETIFYSYKGLWFAEPSEDEPEGRKAVRDRKVPVEIWTVKEYEESGEPPHPVKAIRFEIRAAEPKLRFTGTDIEAMRLAAWGALDEHFAVRWQPYYRVSVSDGYAPRPGDGLTLSWEDVEHGTAHDGTLLLREYVGNGEGWKISPWPGTFSDKAGRAQACIPANAENKAALEAYAAKIGKLREAVRDTLKPEKIETTLALFLQTKQLPAPQE